MEIISECTHLSSFRDVHTHPYTYIFTYTYTYIRVSLGRLHMGERQVQGDKALIGGTHKGGHRPYGGDLTLIDYTIN